MNTHLLQNAQGDVDLACGIARRAMSSVAAYRAIVGTCWNLGEIESYPLVDKHSLIEGRSLNDLTGDDAETAFSIIASSGSSGRPVFWPQLRASSDRMVPALAKYLEAGFGIHKQPTLAIVGLALGSWIGGDYFSWALKNVAAHANYPFAVITPGSRHEEVLRIIARAGEVVDQIILVVCPSAIGHLHLLAESLGIRIPHEKMRYLVLGESFPETMREQLAHRSGHPCPMLSVYGSADTGLLGAESSASAALRSLLGQSPRLREALGLPATVPHLFHNSAPDAYIEQINGELVVTRWQGVPLVRYNLHDRCSLLSWAAVHEAVRSSDEGDASLRAMVLAADSGLADLIAIDGRSDRCLILCGTNISESMLNDACGALVPGGLCTGAYRASLAFENGRRRLAITLEIKDGQPLTPEQDAAIYALLAQSLGRVQPEFQDDWQNVYRRWDAQPEQRILKLTYAAWPTISQRPDGQIKARGIIA